MTVLVLFINFLDRHGFAADYQRPCDLRVFIEAMLISLKQREFHAKGSCYSRFGWTKMLQANSFGHIVHDA